MNDSSKFDSINESNSKRLEMINQLKNYSIGLTYQAFGELNKSIEYFELSESHNLNEINVHTDLGITYYTQGNIKEAEIHFKKATKFDPKDAIALAGLGIINHKNKNYIEAEKYFTEAKKLCPIIEKDIDKLF